ncbi:RICIN domain-containing protein [Tenggerimyces flavus]|uniref:RICIN domain-containing protein n=1 Tax=Tenggerimyces flavus TaxID=1708749 RepID=A0ABV7YJ70_9ACTN|nr:RICIN domain-containing protein [Tenggerimyces flavus]MBM7784731.1 hypothetical protein [Tenggerimyces flavus]
MTKLQTVVAAAVLAAGGLIVTPTSALARPADPAAAPAADVTAIAAEPESYRNPNANLCLADGKDRKLHLAKCTGSDVTKWQVIRDGSHRRFKNVHTGRCLHTSPGGAKAGVTSNCGGHTAQLWKFESHPSGGYRFRSALVNQCISANWLVGGTLETCGSSAPQRWL